MNRGPATSAGPEFLAVVRYFFRQMSWRKPHFANFAFAARHPEIGP
jgi:hypothetical protein